MRKFHSLERRASGQKRAVPGAINTEDGNESEGGVILDNPSLRIKLVDKAKEAFLMAIEVYNKPSIRYRVEGFSFFICNAWELMLKAQIIQSSGESAIYYKDNPGRTISLENCIRIIFTNEHAPIRKNLEKIVELRNTSTHFIVEEYEMVYIPLFQACIFNFNDKMMEFHHIDMTTVVPENFLTLTANVRALTTTEIRAKYPKEIAERFLSITADISSEISRNNSDFAIRIDHRYFITKNKSEATEILAVSKDADSKVQIIKELKDPNDSFKYTAKKCIKEINNRLIRAKVQLIYQGNVAAFNMYHFDLFNKYYGIKANEKLCFTFKVNSAPTYSYSIQAIDFIVEEIKKDPENIIQRLKEHLKKKEANPRSKGFLV